MQPVALPLSQARSLGREPSCNRAPVDVVAAGDVAERFVPVATASRLAPMMRGELEGSAQALPVRLDGHPHLREPHRAVSTPVIPIPLPKGKHRPNRLVAAFQQTGAGGEVADWAARLNWR
jgi:hypothetical protein